MMGDWADEPQWDEFDDERECWTCYGAGCVSPTNTRVSKSFLILGTEVCPDCGGAGREP